MNITIIVVLSRFGNLNGITIQDSIHMVMVAVLSGVHGVISKDYKNVQEEFVRRVSGMIFLGLFSNFEVQVFLSQANLRVDKFLTAVTYG